MEPKQFRVIMAVTIISSFVAASVLGAAFGYVGASMFRVQANPLSYAKNAASTSDNTLGLNGQTGASAMQTEVEQTVKQSSPSVVSVIVSKDVPIIEQYNSNPFDNSSGGDIWGQFFGPQFQVPQYRQNGTQKKEVGGGTGFVISPDGLILTNKHVVEDASADYTVLFNDGAKVPAKVLARDPVEDVAVIKVEKSGLKALPLGDSSGLAAGQFVIAIGNALGEFQNTVSFGVISGLNRNIVAGSNGGQNNEDIRGVIQTDAAINPGNSGGPLLNLNGEVIGINTAIVLDAQNLGFAIPVNKAKKDVDSVIKTGKISTPFIGVRYMIIDEEIKKTNNLTVDHGALIVRGDNKTDLAVVPGSPADKAGLVENDIILEADGVKIDQDHPLANIVSDHSVGDTITLKVFHRGEEKQVQLKLEERK
jgi:serine protease Do